MKSFILFFTLITSATSTLYAGNSGRITPQGHIDALHHMFPELGQHFSIYYEAKGAPGLEEAFAGLHGHIETERHADRPRNVADIHDAVFSLPDVCLLAEIHSAATDGTALTEEDYDDLLPKLLYLYRLDREHATGQSRQPASFWNAQRAQFREAINVAVMQIFTNAIGKVRQERTPEYFARLRLGVQNDPVPFITNIERCAALVHAGLHNEAFEAAVTAWGSSEEYYIMIAQGRQRMIERIQLHETQTIAQNIGNAVNTQAQAYDGQVLGGCMDTTGDRPVVTLDIGVPAQVQNQSQIQTRLQQRLRARQAAKAVKDVVRNMGQNDGAERGTPSPSSSETLSVEDLAAQIEGDGAGAGAGASGKKKKKKRRKSVANASDAPKRVVSPVDAALAQPEMKRSRSDECERRLQVKVLARLQRSAERRQQGSALTGWRQAIEKQNKLLRQRENSSQKVAKKITKLLQKITAVSTQAHFEIPANPTPAKLRQILRAKEAQRDRETSGAGAGHAAADDATATSDHSDSEQSSLTTADQSDSGEQSSTSDHSDDGAPAFAAFGATNAMPISQATAPATRSLEVAEPSMTTDELIVEADRELDKALAAQEVAEREYEQVLARNAAAAGARRAQCDRATRLQRMERCMGTVQTLGAALENCLSLQGDGHGTLEGEVADLEQKFLEMASQIQQAIPAAASIPSGYMYRSLTVDTTRVRSPTPTGMTPNAKRHDSRV